MTRSIFTWTQDNTEDYSDDELAVLTEAQSALEAEYCHTGDEDADWQEADQIHGMLHNEWIDGASADYLIAKVRRRLTGVQ